MHLVRLRLSGFKTFVDPVEVPIEPGMTGIVGPNGCGKSNLVEAMRWAMGESSHRALRAAEMDDVIFAGNARRPARNLAEVGLKIDNSARRAPAEFNASDEIEIVRALTRGSGSNYRVNGREARARDVQTLFADVSSGARSPSLIGQGRVSEIIHAKPEQRRRLLEDAAGIAGLTARRHEAELRLKAAEQNLERAEDVLGQIDQRIETLRRQARTAMRYRQFSEELRRLEQARLLLAWREAQAQVLAAESAAGISASALAEAMRAQGETARAEAIAEHALPEKRDASATAAARLHELRSDLARHETAEREARSRLAEIGRQIEAAGRDLLRERQLSEDAAHTLARLAEEFAAAGETDGGEEALAPLAELLAAADARLDTAEADIADALARQAEVNARRAAAQRARDEAAARHVRARSEAERVAAENTAREPELPRLDELTAAREQAAEVAEAAEAAIQSAEAELRAARDAERHAQNELGPAEKRAAALGAEVATLRKLVQANRSKANRAAIDDIEVDPGYERALAAALGEDLDASLSQAEARHWDTIAASGDPALPAGAEPLVHHVRGPQALARRIAQIGVVEASEAPALRSQLRAGQRLVSRAGDLWRWDGYTERAGAEAPAARRLAERNRLDGLAAHAQDAEATAAELRARLAAAHDTVRLHTEAHQRAVREAQMLQRAANTARDRLIENERLHAAAEARRRAREEAVGRTTAAAEEAAARLAGAENELAGLAAQPTGETEIAALREAVNAARAARLEAAANHEAERRAVADRARRRDALKRDIADWTARQEKAAQRTAEITGRIDSLQADRTELNEAPDEAALAVVRIRRDLQAAEQAAREAADALAAAETARNEVSRAARAALDALSMAREEVARTDERLAAARTKLTQSAETIEDTLGETPQALLHKPELLGIGEKADVEAEIARLTRERERLGPVNLAADGELKDVENGRAALIAEREDITQAIRQLRRGIQTLNEEGRTRLLEAFTRVDANFQKLFSTLFGGGEASLELIETEDPLGAGLEVHAKPPGKRPHTLSLLSGGEQALTALALVFAVFLTSPSPVCVLDEVDAPLDDANVERFCALLATMTAETATRFLVVTHNPITMSRMDRLIGVTMAERGISQLVTVSLAEAERFREAG